MLRETCLANLLRDSNDLNLQERQSGPQKVFISWSGPKSYELASQLSKWLPYIIQSIKPFISSGNIRKGVRWADVLAEELKETHYGIVCITRQNIMSPWLNFEAGALSKLVGQSYVSPLLCGVEPSRLEGPLSQFQATVFDEQKDEKGADIFALVSSINNSLPIQQQVPPDVLKGTFDKWWPDLQRDLSHAMNKKTNETETGLKWLYSVDDLISTEQSEDWESVLVVNPKPKKDWNLLHPAILRNLKQGVSYDFIVPSNAVNEFREQVTYDFQSMHNGADKALDLTKLCIGQIEQDEFQRSAVTHYRILKPKDKSKVFSKVFFEVPVDSCGYWVDTEGQAVDDFIIRFDKMRDRAKCEPISN